MADQHGPDEHPGELDEQEQAAIDRPARVPIMTREAINLPNAFTFLRAALVPVILWLLLVDGTTARWWAFWIFTVAALTDTADGWVARRYGTVTPFGQLADPLADKLLVVGVLASLAWVGEVPWWAVVVIVAREVAVTVLRTRLVQRLALVMPASHSGKIKAVAQMIAIAAYLLPVLGGIVPDLLLYLAVFLTIWSGVDYGFRAGRLARAARGEQGTAEPR
ncbi:MAG: CDP-diacylglycerol--glycerol-3-phosphate 3-phosphatidyltransferase [Nitriliruptoraceae bacterium]